MAKDQCSEYDTTAGNNTVVGDVNIAENCPPSGINNAIRELMSHLKDPQFGKVSVTTDTSAGDDAAMGYTSAEGLILTGQGSTGDVTLKNDADAAVFQVPTGTTNVDFKGNIFTSTAGTSNFVAGVNAGNSIESGGNYNTCVGDEAGTAITTGDGITVVGYGAGDAITTGASNTAIGYNAGGAIIDGGNNTCIGNGAGDAITTSGNNTVVGDNAGTGITTGAGNTSLGVHSLSTLTTGSNNVAVGYEAGYGTGGTFTTSGNVFVGYRSGKANYEGDNNSCIGINSGTALTTGDSNTLLGPSAGASVTTGNGNVCVGNTAGSTLNTGTNNIMIGLTSKGSAASNSHEIVIGANDATGKGGSTALIDAAGGAVYAGNNSADFSTTSDRRIKKNIVDNNIGLEKINQIQVRNFEYRTPDEIDELPKDAAIDNEGVQLGVIAQEVQEFLPQIVNEETTGCLSVDGSDIKWILVNAVKELSAQVNELKGEIKTLKGK